MAIRDIVLYPDAPLREIAEPVDDVDPDISRLIEDMFETMEAYDGSGLAAPQVGVSKRICVLTHPKNGNRVCLINPEISEAEGTEQAEEGCLSFPQLYADVARAARIHVRALDARGKPLDFLADDWLARVVQHEADHLDGIVFPDRLDILSREDKLLEWRAIRENLRTSVEKGASNV
jgi:peptide deformylase